MHECKQGLVAGLEVSFLQIPGNLLLASPKTTWISLLPVIGLQTRTPRDVWINMGSFGHSGRIGTINVH